MKGQSIWDAFVSVHILARFGFEPCGATSGLAKSSKLCRIVPPKTNGIIWLKRSTLGS